MTASDKRTHSNDITLSAPATLLLEHAMHESVHPSEPTTSTLERAPSAERDCREVPAVPPPSFSSDLVDIIGGAILGLVLSAILIV